MLTPVHQLGKTDSMRSNLAAAIAHCLLSLAVGFFSSALSAQPLEPDACYRVQLEERIGWAARTGAWLPNGEAVLVVDQRSSEVISISIHGEVQTEFREVSFEVDSSGQLLRVPSSLRGVNGEFFLLEDAQPSRLLRLNADEQWEPWEDVEGRHWSDSGDIKLMAIWDWVPFNRGVLAYGDLQGPTSQDWESGFLYFGSAAGQQMLRKQDLFDRAGLPHPTRTLYLRNSVYITTLENNGYFLLLEDRAAIVEVAHDGETRELSFFPEEFRHVPQLKWKPGWRGAKQATLLYQAIESSVTAMGLYGSSDGLYLLTKGRAARSSGHTDSWLIRVDPKDGQEISRLLLPTEAAHLTVVPGEEFWALIEKDPVQGAGAMHAPFMKADSVVFLPSGWVSSPDTYQLGGNLKANCLEFLR